MSEVTCLDPEYSTTRLLIRGKPLELKEKNMFLLPPSPERRGEGGLRTRGYYKQSLSGKPLISVVTVVLNGEKCIRESIQSVLDQQYDNVEYIIIDGGSTDTTVDIIKRYENYIDYWISEPDKGIYDAMNKGINLLRGEWVYFLGADDVLISIPVDYFCRESSLVIGNVILFDGKLFRSSYGRKLLHRNTVHHQGVFYSSAVFHKFKYDIRYRVMSDYLLNLTLYKSGSKALLVDTPFARFRTSGASSGVIGKLEWLEIVLKENGSVQFLTALFVVAGVSMKRMLKGIHRHLFVRK